MITRRATFLTFLGVLAPLGVASARDGDAPSPERADRHPRADIQEELVRIERAWAEAVVNPDRAAVQRIICDDFAVTDSTGHVWDRASYLDVVASGVAGLESLRIDDLRVRVYDGTAVVTGRLAYRAGLGRSDLNGTYRFTKTYVRREGGWRCVAAQEGRITG
jgi:ketosteroid isomerase-like protein